MKYTECRECISNADNEYWSNHLCFVCDIDPIPPHIPSTQARQYVIERINKNDT